MDLPHQLFRRCTVLLRIESGGGYVLSHKPVSSPVQPAEKAHFPSAQRTLAIDQNLERPSVHFHSPNSTTLCAESGNSQGPGGNNAGCAEKITRSIANSKEPGEKCFGILKLAEAPPKTDLA